MKSDKTKKTVKTLKKLYDEQAATMACRQSGDPTEQGHFGTSLSLAKMYETGTAAVKQDWVAAYCLYYVAAEKGVVEAEDKLRLLELMMPAEQWREARELIRDVEAKASLK